MAPYSNEINEKTSVDFFLSIIGYKRILLALSYITAD